MAVARDNTGISPNRPGGRTPVPSTYCWLRGADSGGGSAERNRWGVTWSNPMRTTGFAGRQEVIQIGAKRLGCESVKPGSISGRVVGLDGVDQVVLVVHVHSLLLCPICRPRGEFVQN